MAGLTAAELEGVVGVDTSGVTSGLDSALGAFQKFGGKAGKLMAAAGALGGGLFAAGVSGAMTLDEVRGRLQAELGLTAKESERYGDIAGALFSDAYGASVADTGDAVAAVVTSIKGMRKASDSEVEAMTAKALTVADAFGVDVARAAQVAGVAIESGMAKDGVEAFDMLTVAMQRVPKQLREDVLDATEEYSQFFNGLGIEGEQAFALLAKGAEDGMYGIDKTGDAIKEFTIRATDMSAATTEAYKAIGVDSDKMTADLLAGGDRAAGAFQKIVGGLNGMENESAQSAAAIKLFGTPLEDLGTQDIPKFLKSLKTGAAGLGDFEGATDRAGKALYDNARTNVTDFIRSVQIGFVKAVGGYALPAVNSLAKGLASLTDPALSLAESAAVSAGKAVSKFAGWVRDNETPIKVVSGLIVGLFIPHLVALGVASLVNGAKAAAGWIMQNAAALGYAAVHSVVVGLTVAGWVLMGVQSLIQAGRMAAAWLIAMGPIGWAVAAVLAVAAVVIKNWDKVKGATVKAWEAVSGAVSKAWDKVKSMTIGAVEKVIGFVKGNWPKLVVLLTGPIGLAVVGIVKHWDKIKDGASSVFDAIRAIPGKVRSLGATFRDAGKAVLGKLIDGLTSVGGFVGDIAAGVRNAVVGAINNVIDSMNSAIPDSIKVKGLPDVNLPNNPIPNIGFATGGRVTGATYAMLGEGREPESILPDSVLRGLLERTHAAGKAAAAPADRRERGPKVEATFNGIGEDSAREIVEELGHFLKVSEYGGVFGETGAAA